MKKPEWFDRGCVFGLPPGNVAFPARTAARQRVASHSCGCIELATETKGIDPAFDYYYRSLDKTFVACKSGKA